MNFSVLRLHILMSSSVGPADYPLWGKRGRMCFTTYLTETTWLGFSGIPPSVTHRSPPEFFNDLVICIDDVAQITWEWCYSRSHEWLTFLRGWSPTICIILAQVLVFSPCLGVFIAAV